MTPIANINAGWSGSEQLYAHLKDLWTHEELYRSKVNNARGTGNKLLATDDWFIAVDTLAVRVRAFCTDKEKKHLDVFMIYIDLICKDRSIAVSEIGDAEIHEVQETIRAYSIYLFDMMYKYEMLVPKKQTHSASDAFKMG